MSRRHSIIVAVLLGTLVLLLWQHVFVMTGVLWWNAPAPAAQWPALKPLALTPPDTRFVDVEAYAVAHPEWRPR